MSQKYTFDFVESVWVVEQLEALLFALKALDDAGFEFSNPFPEKLEFELTRKISGTDHETGLTDKQLAALDLTIDDLDLSVRSRNALDNANIKTVRALVTKPRRHLLMTKNFGPVSLQEIELLLHQKYDLSLDMELD